MQCMTGYLEALVVLRPAKPCSHPTQPTSTINPVAGKASAAAYQLQNGSSTNGPNKGLEPTASQRASYRKLGRRVVARAAAHPRR